MKLSKSILILGAAVISSSFIVSCGEKKDSAASDGDSSAAIAEAKETPDTLTDEIIVQMNTLADTLLSAKDKASAEAAVKKIDGIGDSLADIAVRMDKLETPTEEKKKELDEKMDKAQASMETKMQDFMKSLMANPEVAQIIGPAMEKFGTRMQEHDKVFERFGKKK